MKTKIRRISKKSLSLFLGLIMLISCLVVNIITTDAAWTKKSVAGSNGTARSVDVYLIPAGLDHGNIDWTNGANFKLWYKDNDRNIDNAVNMTGTGNTYHGNAIYKATISDYYDGESYMAFQLFDSSWNFLDTYEAFTSWTSSNTYKDNMYYGYHDNSHQWFSYSNKDTPLTTPTFTVNKNTINGGDSVTFNVTNWATFSSDANADVYLYKGNSQVQKLTIASTAVTINGDDANALSESMTYSVRAIATSTGITNGKGNSQNNNTTTITVYHPVYSLLGNVSSEYLASVNGSASTADDGWPNTQTYQSAVAVNTATATPGVYSISFQTNTTATLSSYNHSVIDIGLYKKGSAQVGFKKGNNNYNQIGIDYTVPAAGVSDSDGLYVQTMNETNGGGAMVFQANKIYTLTIDETQGSNNGSPNGLITISVSSPAANSTYGLTGNIDSSYIASINGVTNTISQGDIAAATWWPMYHAAAAISTVESTDVYSITFTTVDAATLAANGHSNIDIGLSTTSDQQKGFTINGENYNTVGSDYKLTSAGITNAPIISATGGSIRFQPGRTYKVTVNEKSNSTVTIQCTSGDKYFLAGQYSDGTPQFFGYSWNTANNELPLSSGTTYTKTFSTANQDTIAAGNINFKVVKNGDSDGWDGGSYPSGNTNQSYVIRANPTSVTFSFDSSTGVTTVTQTNSGGETTVSGWISLVTAVKKSMIPQAIKAS